MFKVFPTSFLLAALLLRGTCVFAASDAQQIAIRQDLQVPGNVLKAGTYTLAVEDRMSDRAIIRISSAKNHQHFLVLAVPSSQLHGRAEKGIILFNSRDQAKRILRGWACANCSSPLELVYPKLEAAKITSDTGQSALAVDPESDKLPADLSPDDMKVVTLWLLSPKRVEAGRGVGLNAAKYASTVPKTTTTEVASASPRHLPKTASNIYWLALCGFLLVGSSLVVRATRSIRSH